MNKQKGLVMTETERLIRQILNEAGTGDVADKIRVYYVAQRGSIIVEFTWKTHLEISDEMRNPKWLKKELGCWMRDLLGKLLVQIHRLAGM